MLNAVIAQTLSRRTKNPATKFFLELQAVEKKIQDAANRGQTSVSYDAISVGNPYGEIPSELLTGPQTDFWTILVQSGYTVSRGSNGLWFIDWSSAGNPLPLTGPKGADGDINFPLVEHLDDLKGLVTRPDRVQLGGSVTLGDGHGGFYYWAANSTDVADDFYVVQPTAGPAGRWKRFPESVLENTGSYSNLRVQGDVGQHNYQISVGGSGLLEFTPSTAPGGSTFTTPAITIDSAGTVGYGSDIQIGGSYRWTGKSKMSSPSDGVITVSNSAGTTFSRIQFGGTTSAFPALKRASATLQARLADDSGYADFSVGGLTVNGSFTYGGLTATGSTGTGKLVYSLNPVFDNVITVKNEFVLFDSLTPSSGVWAGKQGWILAYSTPAAGWDDLTANGYELQNFANAVNEQKWAFTVPTLAGGQLNLHALNDDYSISKTISFTRAGGLTLSSGLNINATGTAGVEIGGTTGAFIDLKSPYSDDYDVRLTTTGTGGSLVAAGSSTLTLETGTGTVAVKINGSNRVTFAETVSTFTGNVDFPNTTRISNGRIGLATTSLTDRIMFMNTPVTGATSTYGIVNGGQIQSDVTVSYNAFYSGSGTQAASFTLPTYIHYIAQPPATFGAGSSVTNQYGFFVSSTMTGAGTNFGFYSGIASGSGRYNFYAGGTAENYFAGLTTFGSSVQTIGGESIYYGTAIPAGGTTGTGYKFSSTANFGVFFGSGAPTLSAAQGSLYVRSDGAPYYNNNGTTGWTQIGAGITAANDSSTATLLYPLFSSAATGTITNVYTNNGGLNYKPSTGELSAKVLNATSGFVMNALTVSANFTVPSGSSAMSVGPITVSAGVTVTVSAGSRWVVL